LADMRVHLIRL